MGAINHLDYPQNVWLSPSEATRRTSPLQAYSASQCATVAARLSTLLQHWSLQWGWSDVTSPARSGVADQKPLHVLTVAEYVHSQPWVQTWQSIDLPSARPTPCWQIHSQSAATGLTAQTSVRKAIQGILWGETASVANPMSGLDGASLAAELAQDAWHDLWHRWDRLCSGHAQESTPSALPERTLAIEASCTLVQPGPWAGYLFAEFWLHDVCMGVALRPDHVQCLCQSAANSVATAAVAMRPTLVGLDQALHQHTLGLHAYLPSVSVALGQLQHLRVGDVLTLDHPLDCAIPVYSDRHLLIAQAWLGQAQGCVAIELKHDPLL